MIFCYANVLKKLRQTYSEIQINTGKKATKKIIGYFLIFTIHWIRILIQYLGIMFGVRFIELFVNIFKIIINIVFIIFIGRTSLDLYHNKFGYILHLLR